MRPKTLLKATLILSLATLLFSNLSAQTTPCSITDFKHNFGWATRTPGSGDCITSFTYSFVITAPDKQYPTYQIYFYGGAGTLPTSTTLPATCTENGALGAVGFTISFSGTTPSSAALVSPAMCPGVSPSNLTFNSVTGGYEVKMTVAISSGSNTCPDFIGARLFSIKNATTYCNSNLTSNLNLPVTFGTIKATKTNGKLNIDWQTVSEENVKAYNLEASTDGTQWTKIGSVSPNTGGNSNDLQNYHFSAGLPLALGGLSIGMLILSIFVRSRALRILMVLAVVGFVISCNKNVSEVDLAKQDTLYVRIVQQDNNNGLQYSKIIKVVNE